MRKRYVHIGFNYEDATAPIDELEKTFNKAVDWLRYDAHCWILYTGLELDVWRDRIRNTKGITENTGFVLTEFNAERTSGWVEEWIWDWLTKKRDP